MPLIYGKGDFSREVNAGLNQTLDGIFAYISRLFELLQDNTPVDTGFAQSRWQVSITDTGLGGPVTDVGIEVNPVKALGAIRDALGRFTNLKNLGLNKLIVIFNDARYIVFLDQGSSRKAPKGIVQISITQANAEFR